MQAEIIKGISRIEAELGKAAIFCLSLWCGLKSYNDISQGKGNSGRIRAAFWRYVADFATFLFTTLSNK